MVSARRKTQCWSRFWWTGYGEGAGSLSEIDDKITALTGAWYAYAGMDHHKDRDCHFYIEKVWSYGNSPIYRVSHPGYITDFVSHDFQTSAEAHLWLYRTLWSRCKDALENLQTRDSFPFHGDDERAARVIKELEAALAL